MRVFSGFIWRVQPDCRKPDSDQDPGARIYGVQMFFRNWRDHAAESSAGGTVAEFSRKAQDKTVRNTLIVYLVLLAVGMILIQPVYGVVIFVTAVLVFIFINTRR